MRYVFFATVIALAACSQTSPLPTDSPASPTTATEAPAAADGPMICIGLGQALCDEVLAAAVHNLAGVQALFTGPGTVMEGDCPDALPEYFADDTPCWYVTLPLRTVTTPQVVMARRDDGVIAQAGGDAISGQATIPSEDVGGAPEACRTAARAYSGMVVAAYFATLGAIRRLPGFHDNSDTANYADDQEATVCYIDGQIPKSPPPPASGTPYPSFDRVIILAVGEIPHFISAGYRDNMPIRAP